VSGPQGWLGHPRQGTSASAAQNPSRHRPAGRERHRHRRVGPESELRMARPGAQRPHQAMATSANAS